MFAALSLLVGRGAGIAKLAGSAALVAVVGYLVWDYRSSKDRVVALTAAVDTLTTTIDALKAEEATRDRLRQADLAAIRETVERQRSSATVLARDVARIKEVAAHAPPVACPVPPPLGAVFDQLRQQRAGAGGGAPNSAGRASR